MASCPPVELLRRFLADELAAEVRDQVQAHVSACPACQGRCEDLTAAPELAIVPHATPRVDCGAGEAALAELMQRLLATPPTAFLGDPPSPAADNSIRFPVPPSPTAPLGGLGDYAILEHLGSGGYGLVFKALDTRLRRIVAIKVLRPYLATTPEARARFEREARAAAALQHEHIVSLYDVVDPPDFPPYLVIEYVAGGSFSKRLLQPNAALRENVALLRQVALGLAAAHAQGVIHRDIKPSNILVDEATGKAKLSDFGLAFREEDEVTLTLDGQVLGTPAYMSPEQAAGRSHEVGPPSDVYSLGVVLYQLLTRRLPFEGNARELLFQVLHLDPPAPRSLNPNIPAGLAAITQKCLEKRPAQRYPTAAELADDLGRWLNDEPVRARPPGLIRRLGRRHRRAVLLGLLALGVLLLVGVVSVRELARWSFAHQRAVAAASLQAGAESLREGDHEQARTSYQAALEQTQRLLVDHPDDVDLLIDLATVYEQIAKLEELDSEFTRARSACEKALAVLAALEAAGKSSGRAAGHEWRDRLEEDLTHYEEAEAVIADLDYVKGLTASHAANLLSLRAAALAQQGRHSDIPATAERLRALNAKDAENLYDIACCYGLAVQAVQEDSQLDQRQAEQLERRYADQALADLRAAINAGFRDVKLLQDDPDFDAIRRRAGFRAMVRELRDARRPGSPGGS